MSNLALEAPSARSEEDALQNLYQIQSVIQNQSLETQSELNALRSTVLALSVWAASGFEGFRAGAVQSVMFLANNKNFQGSDTEAEGILIAGVDENYVGEEEIDVIRRREVSTSTIGWLVTGLQMDATAGDRLKLIESLVAFGDEIIRHARVALIESQGADEEQRGGEALGVVMSVLGKLAGTALDRAKQSHISNTGKRDQMDQSQVQALVTQALSTYRSDIDQQLGVIKDGIADQRVFLNQSISDLRLATSQSSSDLKLELIKAVNESNLKLSTDVAAMGANLANIGKSFEESRQVARTYAWGTIATIVGVGSLIIAVLALNPSGVTKAEVSEAVNGAIEATKK